MASLARTVTTVAMEIFSLDENVDGVVPIIICFS